MLLIIALLSFTLNHLSNIHDLWIKTEYIEFRNLKINWDYCWKNWIEQTGNACFLPRFRIAVWLSLAQLLLFTPLFWLWSQLTWCFQSCPWSSLSWCFWEQKRCRLQLWWLHSLKRSIGCCIDQHWYLFPGLRLPLPWWHRHHS